MSSIKLKTLENKAGEMALDNIWGEDAYKINMEILALDINNCAACTRLAKYYKMNDNIEQAKNMYLRALEIDPNSRGAINNLSDIKKDEQETEDVEKIKTTRELLKEGKSSMLKGRYKLAEKLFSKAYSMDPVLATAVHLASVYKELDKDDSVEKLYKELIKDKHMQSDIDVVDHEFRLLRPNKK